MCASRLHVTFYSGYMKAKSDNRITNLNKTARKVFERSTNVTLNLMFVVYVVASCVRLIGRRSSGWSVISTSSLFFSLSSLFLLLTLLSGKATPELFLGLGSRGEKKKKAAVPRSADPFRESHTKHTKNGQKTLTYWSTSDSLMARGWYSEEPLSITWCAGMNIIMQDDAREQSSACVPPLPSVWFICIPQMQLRCMYNDNV